MYNPATGTVYLYPTDEQREEAAQAQRRIFAAQERNAARERMRRFIQWGYAKPQDDIDEEGCGAVVASLQMNPKKLRPIL